jgi:hypothetical protein
MFDVLSIIFQMLSQISLVFLFILISWGYTITYDDFGEDIDIYIPVGVMITVVHAMIAGLTYINNDAEDKFHDYQGIQGLIIILLRIGLFIYFLFGIRSTAKAARQKAKPFLRFFTITATIYMLALPIMFMIGLVLAPYLRHRMIVFGHTIL